MNDSSRRLAMSAARPDCRVRASITGRRSALASDGDVVTNNHPAMTAHATNRSWSDD